MYAVEVTDADYDAAPHVYAQAERIAEKFIERQRLPRDYRVITKDLLKKVAEMYRDNIHAAPTKAVAKHFGVKDRMASTYVDRARKAGYLPPTKQDQKKAVGETMANANGEGSIYKRMRNGRQVGYIGAIGDTESRASRSGSMVYGKTRTESRDKTNRARTADIGPPSRTAATPAEWRLAHWRVTTGCSSRKESSAKRTTCAVAPLTQPFGARSRSESRASVGRAPAMRARPSWASAPRRTNPQPVRDLSDVTIRQT